MKRHKKNKFEKKKSYLNSNSNIDMSNNNYDQSQNRYDNQYYVPNKYQNPQTQFYYPVQQPPPPQFMYNMCHMCHMCNNCNSNNKLDKLVKEIQRLNKTVINLKKELKKLKTEKKVSPIFKNNSMYNSPLQKPFIPLHSTYTNPIYSKPSNIFNNLNSNKFHDKRCKNRNKNNNNVDGLIILNRQEKNILGNDKAINSLINDALDSLFGKKKEKKSEEKKKDLEKDEQSFEIDLNTEYDELDIQVKTLDDLIKLGEMYDNEEHKAKKYSFDLKMMNKLLDPMKKLNNMIGMKDVKKSITEFIIYHSQRLEKQTEDMFHTVIQGPPGVGKTELGKILGKIYCAMGIIKSDKFKIVKRSDLIGKYLGHTASQTQDIIDECEGGVLFIDEAYSLGNEDGKDTYSKECIDTLNMNLSENKKNFVCIIAGYKESLDRCFFSYNEGLRRRFSFRYTINGYNPLELSKIFSKKAKELDFDFDSKMLESQELEKFFEKNKASFPDYGGDMETLLLNCKITHSNRIFGKHPKLRKKITKSDIKKGLERFLLHRQIKDNFINYMYI